MEKPFSQSCVENREPILAVLQTRLAGCRRLLEIGSGTGQHAVYFAPELPQIFWQTSDKRENHDAILAWLADSEATNIGRPISLEVLQDPWPSPGFDVVFSANTAHIMPLDAVEAMFRGVGSVLNPGGQFLLYGPFNYDGRFTSASNERFDGWLKQQNQAMGIRDLSVLAAFASEAGMYLQEDIEMPVNNRTLVWGKER
jgi:cyclopropane fatty-acyl-phospholipid synthase-like methyltransferase